jgi:hypothetical protein
MAKCWARPIDGYAPALLVAGGDRMTLGTSDGATGPRSTYWATRARHPGPEELTTEGHAGWGGAPVNVAPRSLAHLYPRRPGEA